MWGKYSGSKMGLILNAAKCDQWWSSTLKYRKLRGDIKIINQKYDCAVAPKLISNPNSVTRWNNYI